MATYLKGHHGGGPASHGLVIELDPLVLPFHNLSQLVPHKTKGVQQLGVDHIYALFRVTGLEFEEQQLAGGTEVNRGIHRRGKGKIKGVTRRP
eukprot:9484708-Pyramimonas_sp.AAC.1